MFSIAPSWWQKAQNWVADVRDGRNRWSQNAIERLKELKLEKGTIGISGLAGLVRAPEGIIPYSSVKAIQEALPHAKLVNATDMMQDVRAVKSAEEVSMLERSAAIIEKAIEAMKQTAKPGVSEKEVYATMLHAMLSNGGELPTLFFLSAGPNLFNSSFVPTDYVIQERRSDLSVRSKPSMVAMRLRRSARPWSVNPIPSLSERWSRSRAPVSTRFSLP